MRYRETFIIKHGERLILKGVDPAGKQHHESELGAKDEIEHYRSQLAKLQSLLYAERKRSILVVLQAMDAGGKDGVVNHVLSVLKPTSFRDPRLGRSATNCRSRRFEATVAIWRSPSSFGRRRRRGRARRLQAHQPLDPVQTAFDTVRQQVLPDTPYSIGSIAGKEACLHLQPNS